METYNREVVNNNFLRQRVKDMIQNLETMVTNIKGVLGEIGQIVHQIDSVTDRLESKHRSRVKKPDVLLDANSNQCDMLETPLVSCNSKLTLTSPYMDFTYLDLAKDCEVCDGALNKFTYNEKYPLWIQYDTWRTGNTASEMSVVSAGSDTSSQSCISGSDLMTFKTWNSLTRGETDGQNGGKKQQKITVAEYKDPDSGQDDGYCGLYEEMMEKQLESIDLLYEEVGSDIDDDSFCDDVSDCASFRSMSLSDDHVVRYNKNLSTWTSFRMVHMGHSIDSGDSSDECVDV